ncbi:hypothetical protein HII31_08690, partial [Pseudocercospora fuligena]
SLPTIRSPACVLLHCLCPACDEGARVLAPFLDGRLVTTAAAPLLVRGRPFRLESCSPPQSSQRYPPFVPMILLGRSLKVSQQLSQIVKLASDGRLIEREGLLANDACEPPTDLSGEGFEPIVVHMARSNVEIWFCNARARLMLGGEALSEEDWEACSTYATLDWCLVIKAVRSNSSESEISEEGRCCRRHLCMAVTLARKSSAAVQGKNEKSVPPYIFNLPPSFLSGSAKNGNGEAANDTTPSVWY